MEDPHTPVLVAQATRDLGWSARRCWVLAGFGAALVVLGGYLYSGGGQVAEATPPAYSSEYR